MTKRLARLMTALSLSTVFLLSGVPLESTVFCNTYNNSRPAYVWGSYTCAYTGSGCDECYNSNGSYCVGSEGSIYCDGPDFQN